MILRSITHSVRTRLFVTLTLATSLVACGSDGDSSGALGPVDATPDITVNAPDDTDAGGANTDTSGASTELLPPLPDPSLTEGPSADDEPVPFDAVFHTITQFQALRDTGPRIQQAVAPPEFTEADFNAGLGRARDYGASRLEPCHQCSAVLCRFG